MVNVSCVVLHIISSPTTQQVNLPQNLSKKTVVNSRLSCDAASKCKTSKQLLIRSRPQWLTISPTLTLIFSGRIYVETPQ